MIAAYHPDRESIVVSFFDGFKPEVIAEKSLTFAELAALASNCTVADCPCCRYDPADPKSPSPKKCNGKARAPSFGPYKLSSPHRLNENVVEVTAFVIDIDHREEAAVDDVMRKIAPYSWIAYTTHGHGALMPKYGPGDWSLRLILPMTKPVPAAMWGRFREEVLRRLDLTEDADPKCKEPSRFYYLYSAARSRTDRAFSESDLEGGAIDTAAVLAALRVEREARNAAALEREARKALPAEVIPAATDSLLWKLVKECRKNKARKIESPGNREKVALLDKLIDGEPLSGVGGRDAAIWHLATILSNKWPEDCTGEDFVRIARPSLAGMELDHGESLDEWLSLAAEKFDRKIEEVRDHKAEVRAENKATQGEFLTAIEQAFEQMKAAPAATPSAPAASKLADEDDGDGDAPDEDDRPMIAKMADWVTAGMSAEEGETPLLHYTMVEGKDGTLTRKITPDLHNLTQFLLDSPAWRNVIRYDTVHRRREVDPTRFPEKLSGESMFPVALRSWFQQQLRLNFSKEIVVDAIAAVAEYNAYDPVKDYLNGLRWDGVPRIDNFLIDYCFVSTVSDDGSDITEHVRRVSSKILIGAAARGLVPGTKMDSTLVLEGKQGYGKTSVLEALGDKFYTPFDSGLDKDAKIIAARMWIMELGELASIRNSKAQDEIKSFLTTRKEFLRPAYGQDHKLFERRAVTVATTNEFGYLVDLTGNRRYWPVEVTARIDVHRVRQDRDQLWAEAAHRARAAMSELAAGVHADNVTPANRWWLVGAEEEDAAAREVERRLYHDSFADMIEDWFAKQPPEKRPVAVKSYDIARDALSIDNDRFNSQMSTARQVANALTRLRFVHKRTTVGSQRMWLWYTPKHILELPHNTRKVTEVPTTLIPATASVAASAP